MLHVPLITQLIKGRARGHYHVLVTPASSPSFHIAHSATFLPSVRAHCPFLAPCLSVLGTVTPLLVPPHPKATGTADPVSG